MQDMRVKRPALFQIIYRLLNISPICILRKDRADSDFKRGLARPPVLRAEGPVKDAINVGKDFFVRFICNY
jgi:hypothetical protein